MCVYYTGNIWQLSLNLQAPCLRAQDPARRWGRPLAGRQRQALGALSGQSPGTLTSVKGSVEGDIDIDTNVDIDTYADVDIDMDINVDMDSDIAVSIHWGSFKRGSVLL